jgi:hypothetical protein
MFKYLSPRRSIKMGPAPVPPVPLDCNTEITAAIAAAIDAFTCIGYETAGSGSSYAAELGVCSAISGDCPACEDSVGAALEVYYYNNCT